MSNSGGRFRTGCRNHLHDSWLQFLDKYEDENAIKLTTNLRRPRDVQLKQLEQLGKRPFTQDKRRPLKVCEHCLNVLQELCPATTPTEIHVHDYVLNAKKRLKVDENTPPPSEFIEDDRFTVEDVLSPKFYHQLSTAQLEQVARIIGDIVSSRLSRRSVDRLYRDRDYLLNIDPDDYSDKYDSILRSFISAFTSHNTETTQTLKCLLYEQILHLKYQNAILPLSFMQNILLYTQTNSREAVNLIGSSGPYGKYDTIHDWLKSQSIEPLSFPNEDCVVIFDNNQVIGRSWAVKVKNKSKSSTVTTICQIEFPGYGSLQKNAALQEHFWTRSLSEIRASVREISPKNSATHYHFLYLSLANHLHDVLQQQITDGGVIQDNIDQLVQKQNTDNGTKMCSKCGVRNTKTKRNCIACKTNLKKAELEESGQDMYGTFGTIDKKSQTPRHHKEVRLSVIQQGDSSILTPGTPTKTRNGILQHVESGHRPVPPKMSESDPCFVNPNSYESCRLTLRQIGLKAGIQIYGTGDRQWMFVVCDGLPFGLCKEVIAQTLRCRTCDRSEDSFHGQDQFLQHHNNCHSEIPYTEKCQLKEFQWVILRPGNGHIEMNMMKSFTSLNWDVFMDELAKLMGFCSENAQKAAKNCTDNHKAWTIIETAYEGNMKELLVPYVRHCLSNGVDATPQGFIKYTTIQAANPNYIYLALMTLTYLQAIMNMRAGLRRNNTDLIVSAKSAFAPLFHARNHPKYRDLEMVEAIQRTAVPDEMIQFFNETESVSLNGDPYTGEGLDFKAETVNKDVQAWMPGGVPDGNDWLRVTRNLDKLKQLGKKCKELYGVKRRQTGQRNNNISEQITAYRVLLRSKEYLLSPLDKTKTHHSLSGIELDSDLINFQERATNRRTEYYDTKYENVDATKDTSMVCVTTDERRQMNDIQNQSKSSICDVADSLLEKIVDKEYQATLKSELNGYRLRLSRTKRDILIIFHSKLMDVIAEQDIAQDIQENEDE